MDPGFRSIVPIASSIWEYVIVGIQNWSKTNDIHIILIKVVGMIINVYKEMIIIPTTLIILRELQLVFVVFFAHSDVLTSIRCHLYPEPRK